MALELAPLNSEPLHEQAYSALRDALRRGRFPVDRSVPLRELSLQLGISVTPVRDALQRLVAEGALELTPTRRIRVPPMTPELYTEIIDIRLRLEPMALARALPRRNPALLDDLIDLSQQMTEAMVDNRFSDYLVANEAFHFRLYEASGQDFLVQIISNCWLRIGPWLAMLVAEGRFHAIANTEHDRMIEALREGNEAELVAALDRDIQDAADNLLSRLRRTDDAGRETGGDHD
ncbi:GntR family transcriptional regulator [Devosia sp. A369]